MMDDKIPAHILKPQLAKEIPRAEYVLAPRFQPEDEQSRRSFIALLRKGPSKEKAKSTRPAAIKINCALWLTLNKPIDSCVSFVAHCRDGSEEYCMILDEIARSSSESLMLAGNVTIQPKQNVEFIRLAYCGITKDYHVMVKDAHYECEVLTNSLELQSFG